MAGEANRADLTLEQLFPRIDKRALGFAVGLTVGGVAFALTLIHLAIAPAGIPLWLLGQYFYGYDVTWPGAVAGLLWGGLAGFVAGWLVGLVHNLTLDIWLMIVRERTDLSQHRNIAEHLR